jgi:hypothetical protein
MEPLSILKALGSVASFFGSLRKHSRENLENEILEYLAHERDWQSAVLIWGDRYFNTVLPGIPLSYYFPSSDLKGWAKAKARLAWKWHSTKIAWRKSYHLPSVGKIGKALFLLWKSGHLQRASFNPKFYRLR